MVEEEAAIEQGVGEGGGEFPAEIPCEGQRDAMKMGVGLDVDELMRQRAPEGDDLSGGDGYMRSGDGIDEAAGLDVIEFDLVVAVGGIHDGGDAIFDGEAEGSEV